MKNRIDELDDFPIPVKTIPADETASPRQSFAQMQVEWLAGEFADKYAKTLGLSRREFLSGACGSAVVFMAMNSDFGDCFSVDVAEAADPAKAQERQKALAGQFIFDIQTHFVSPEFDSTWILQLREKGQKWNPELQGEKVDLEKLRFENFYREIFEGSDTKMAVLSSAPDDDPKKWFLHNDEMAKARERVNQRAGRKVFLTHALVTPGHPNWLEEIDRAVSEYKPDAWKGYTVGSPFKESKYPWRLDDEQLMYPAYEKMVKSGITNLCIHKGLLPAGYESKMSKTWQYAKIDDLSKAAKDWPQLNFLIYHSALKSGEEPSRQDIQEFEQTGYIPWITELAAMPEKNGVTNVYAELGSVFAITAVSAPKYCAGILGTLIKGLGADHVLWGTDSVWYGSPQWQIEAFRRLEIPEDLQKKFGLAPLGAADGKTKTMILGETSAKLYKVRE
jgi:predicted TIM-barrel fold metal-dependent hydrolase